MIAYGWYYLVTGRKRHVVRESELAAFPQQKAICGNTVLAFLPSRARWQNDAEGLSERDECASCRRVLQFERAASEALDELARQTQEMERQ